MVCSHQPSKGSHFSEKFKIAEKWAFFMRPGTLFFAHFFSNCSHFETKKILASNQLQIAPNFLDFYNKKGAFEYLKLLWSFLNSKTGLICSKIFDNFREILVQVNKAVYELIKRAYDLLLIFKMSKATFRDNLLIKKLILNKMIAT